MPRQVVKWFSERMEEKLLENDHKASWTETDFDYLLLRLKQELEELEEALEDPLSPNDAIKEAADVANFALFIADMANRIKNNSEWGERGK